MPIEERLLQQVEERERQAKVDIAMIGKDQALVMALAALAHNAETVDALTKRVEHLENEIARLR